MNWGQLAKRIEKMTPAEKRQPVTFVEPYDDEAAIFRGLGLCKAKEEILDPERCTSFTVRVDFISSDDYKVYGSEEYTVEAESEEKAREKALKMSDNSQYDDPRVDHRRAAEVIGDSGDFAVALPKGDFLLHA